MEQYDWYGTWNTPGYLAIRPHLLPHLPPNAQRGSVLNVGCGNSRLTEELIDDGYTDVMSIDISGIAIEKMTQKFSGRAGMSFLKMDATQMSFADGSFDLVFEKGTLDAMYTGASHMVRQVVEESFRVLRPGGVFISVTFGPPNARQDLNLTGLPAIDPSDAAFADVGADVAAGAAVSPAWARFQAMKIERGDKGGVMQEANVDDKRNPGDALYVYLGTKRG